MPTSQPLPSAPARPVPAPPRLGVDWQCAGLIRRRDFAPEQQLPPSGTPEDPVMTGQLRRLQLQPGLWLLCAETQELRSLHTRSVAESGLRVVVVLDGCMDLNFGDCHVHVDTATAGHACGSVIHTSQPQQFERRRESGHSERRLSLYLTPEWLAAQALQTPELWARQPAFWQAPAAARAWTPSPRAVALAEQVLQLSKAPQGMDGLRLTGQVLELVHEALESALAPPAAAPAAALRPRDHERLMRLRHWLEQEGEAADASLPTMARSLGLSPSALQRQFRQAFGCSIEGYRRDVRLERAYVQLQRGGRSVAEVADAAGYTSAANFATAFKRKYGLSPKQVRAAL